MRVLALIDGEHHPSAVRAAIQHLRSGGDEVVAAIFCGGTEKVDAGRLDDAYGVPLYRGGDLLRLLREAIEDLKVEAIVDVTEEPGLSTRDRYRLGVGALSAGVVYRGADFEWRPPVFERVLTKPSVRVFATAKRSGKTALASALARRALTRGLRPLIVAVGRGGPETPLVIEAGSRLDPERLLELADRGLHAASDYVEDALTSGVATIGCLRAGGGLAGGTVYSNIASAARLAEEREEDLVILEGSGASIPGVHARAGIVCVPADAAGGSLTDHLSPFRLLLADLAVVTMAEEGSAAAEIETSIREAAPGIDVVHVVFRPEPLTQISGRRVFLCSTAAPEAGHRLRGHLERVHGCEVVGMTHQLADRSRLRRELETAPAHEVVLTELKGAAVEVAVRVTLEAGREVAFVDNVVVGVTGSNEETEAAFDRILDLAADREP